MPEYGILNTEAHKDNDVPAKWSKTWPCLGALALQTCRSWPKFWTALSELLDTQWHVRILVSVFGKFQIETDFAPLAFVCGGGDEGEWGRVWPIFRQSKC